ncbi:hypothetical protein [Stenotrophomonas sp.]|uniref:hypothetical protein n=1 Tax=Stenotrophomonas sp. TaxID=69392 RepID=UPI0028A7BE27|nr:hypothetical protein [Stenotrophomonas sp.]
MSIEANARAGSTKLVAGVFLVTLSRIDLHAQLNTEVRERLKQRVIELESYVVIGKYTPVEQQPTTALHQPMRIAAARLDEFNRAPKRAYKVSILSIIESKPRNRFLATAFGRAHGRWLPWFASRVTTFHMHARTFRNFSMTASRANDSEGN